MKLFKIIALTIMAGLCFGLLSVDGGTEIPGTRFAGSGCQPEHLQGGKPFVVDAQDRIHMIYGQPGSFVEVPFYAISF